MVMLQYSAFHQIYAWVGAWEDGQGEVVHRLTPLHVRGASLSIYL
jgi:hypothetical protein